MKNVLEFPVKPKNLGVTPGQQVSAKIISFPGHRVKRGVASKIENKKFVVGADVKVLSEAPIVEIFKTLKTDTNLSPIKLRTSLSIFFKIRSEHFDLFFRSVIHGFLNSRWIISSINGNEIMIEQINRKAPFYECTCIVPKQFLEII
jgi:hypothetical protein